MNKGEFVWYDERLKITRVFDDIYLLDDNDEGSAYVVIGSEKAMVIDTCNGEQDFKAAVRTLTDLPLIVVNTHAHGDHVGGDVYFDEVYISDKEISEEDLKKAPQISEHLTVKFMRGGDIFDLGNKKLEAIDFAGHTPGGMCMLDREDRVMFTGDSVLGRTVWMFMPNSVPISTFKQSLINLNSYRSDFDFILTGHSRKTDDPAYIDALIEACDTVLAKEPAERFSTFEIRGETLPLCYYKGEDGNPGTLVYREELAK